MGAIVYGSDNCCASLSASLSPAPETVAIPHWKVGLKSSGKELTFSDEQLDCSFMNNLWLPAVMPWLAPGCLCISLFEKWIQRCVEGNIRRLHTDIMLTCWLTTSSNIESLIVKGIKNSWLEQPITVQYLFVLPAELKNIFPTKTLILKWSITWMEDTGDCGADRILFLSRSGGWPCCHGDPSNSAVLAICQDRSLSPQPTILLMYHSSALWDIWPDLFNRLRKTRKSKRKRNRERGRKRERKWETWRFGQTDQQWGHSEKQSQQSSKSGKMCPFSYKQL